MDQQLTDSLTRGLSRLSDQGRMVAMLQGADQTHFANLGHLGLRTTFYIMMCDTPPLRGERISAWLGGVEFFGRE